MSFPAYPEYKDSGVEWLGEVPAHWEVVKLGYLGISQGGGTPPKDELQYWNGNIPWVTPKDMKQQWITSTIDTLSEAALHASPVSMIEPGHVLIVFRSGILRHRIPVAINEVPVTVNQDLRAYNVKPRLLPAYFLRLTQGLNRELLPEWSKQGATVESLDSELVSSTQLPVPPRTEQETIAIFLDHETARIDALIAEQQRLIALLKEKRQAVISHAVTKGLDPDAPMKDSGVEWLGDVPAHWGVGRLKHSLRIQGGQDYKAVESIDSTDYPVIGSGGQFTYATSYLYDGESVLLGRKGTIDKPLYIKGKFWTVDTMFYTEVLPKTNGRYAYYAATTIPFSLYSTNTALPSMSQFDLANHAQPLPGYQEQTQIATFLDHETTHVDALIAQGKLAIELLQERRSALISAAVTGKIDVRGWQPPSSSAATAQKELV